MTLNLPLSYVLWLEECCQIRQNKNKSPNLWHVTSILVCWIFVYLASSLFYSWLKVKVNGSNLYWTQVLFRARNGSDGSGFTPKRRVDSLLQNYFLLLFFPIKGWCHCFGSVVYGCIFWELRRPCRWQKCKQTAVDDTYYQFTWHHSLITQLNDQTYWPSSLILSLSYTYVYQFKN